MQIRYYIRQWAYLLPYELLALEDALEAARSSMTNGMHEDLVEFAMRVRMPDLYL